ncbi:thioredoxin-like protein [Spinellus fusiger]|nr:thioredoxin-like protein [Spinellus fusiger]
MNFLRSATRTSVRVPSTVFANSHARISARWISDSLRQKIDQDIKSSDIVMYMKGTPDQPMCGFSRATVQILQVQGVDFSSQVKTFNILEDDDLRTGIKEYSEWPTIPQVYVKGTFVGGCDIMLNMHQSGELEDLLVKENIVSLE